MACAHGQYEAIMKDKIITLNPGDELYIPPAGVHVGDALQGQGQYMPSVEKGQKGETVEKQMTTS